MARARSGWRRTSSSGSPVSSGMTVSPAIFLKFWKPSNLARSKDMRKLTYPVDPPAKPCKEGALQRLGISSMARSDYLFTSESV
ncbi:MAG TPA: hypothetical protein VJQ06_07900, partial [Rhizomicrobium sp.]|nr:hypothetical protein [Rhizomicrobium sp.]